MIKMAAETRIETPTERLINIINNDLDRLGHSVDALQEKLQPYRKPDVPESATSESIYNADVNSSEHVKKLERIMYRIISTINTVDNTKESLDI